MILLEVNACMQNMQNWGGGPGPLGPILDPPLHRANKKIVILIHNLITKKYRNKNEKVGMLLQKRTDIYKRSRDK